MPSVLRSRIVTEEKREIPGEWWISDNPTEKWIGTLDLNYDKTPRLNASVPKGFFQPQKKDGAFIIHGTNRHGIPITLLFASPPRLQQAAALTQMSFSAGNVVLGIHLANVESFKVHSLNLRMQHLFEWGGITGLKRQQGQTFHDFQISYSRPKNQSFPVTSDITMELRSAYSGSDDLKGQKVDEDLFICFESKGGLGLQQCNELVRAVRHLLHFAVLNCVYPLSITAYQKDYGETYEQQFVQREIEIWNSLLRTRVESEFFSERWIFQLKDVQKEFGTFMGKWLEYLKKFDEALDNYFSTIYHPLPHSIAHLCLTQAFDAYHGIKFDSHDDFGFEKKVRELTEANQSSLKGLVDDATDFATTVNHNRNFYTHHNPKWKKGGRVVSGADLYRLNEKLKLIFQMCVLADMGIPTERFIRLRRQLASKIIDYA